MSSKGDTETARNGDTERTTGSFSPRLPIAASPRRFLPRLILWLIVAVVLLYGVIYPNGVVLMLIIGLVMMVATRLERLRA